MHSHLSGGVAWFQIAPERFAALALLFDPKILQTWRFGAIFRRDVLSQSISYVYATNSGVWSASGGEDAVTVSPSGGAIFKEIAGFLRHIQNSENLSYQFLNQFEFYPFFIQYYEDIISSPREEVLRFFRFLGIKYQLSTLDKASFDVGRKIIKADDMEVYEAFLNHCGWISALLTYRKQCFAGARSMSATGLDTAQQHPLGGQLFAIASHSEVIERLEAAIEAARAGRRKEARQVVFAAIAALPDDLNVLHKSGVVLRYCGDYHEALGYFHRALEISPGFHFTLIEIADTHVDLGRSETGLDWYYKAIESEPQYWLPYVRAAQLEHTLGRNSVAVELLERAGGLAPPDREFYLLHAQYLVYQNSREAAVGVYQRLIGQGLAQDQDHFEYVLLLQEIGDYHAAIAYCNTLDLPDGSPLYHGIRAQVGHAKLALRFCRDSVIQAAAKGERKESWLSTTAIIQVVRDAIATQKPFSLVRVGDGEARFLISQVPKLMDALTADEAFSIGETIWTNWFGESLAQVGVRDLRDLTTNLRGAIENADILGIPTVERLRRDNKHFGYLSHLMHMLRNSGDAFANARRFSDAAANLDIHRHSPFYQELLADVNLVGVVSPHAPLASRLGRHLGIERTINHVVPGEMRLPHDPAMGRGLDHFPQRYNQLLSELDVPHPGTVFLVAAGLLGKIYCHRIKTLGGIALDIGAIADAWMGFDTRPGSFEKNIHWRLPEGE